MAQNGSGGGAISLPAITTVGAGRVMLILAFAITATPLAMTAPASSFRERVAPWCYHGFMVAKLSVSLPEDVHRWALEHAERQGVGLSSVIAGALRMDQRRHLQQAAWRELMGEVLDEPLTDAELGAAKRELAACDED